MVLNHIIIPILLLVVGILRFALSLIVFPFFVFGTANALFSEGYDNASEEDIAFFYVMGAFSSTLFLFFVDLTNISLGLVVSVLSGF